MESVRVAFLISREGGRVGGREREGKSERKREKEREKERERESEGERSPSTLFFIYHPLHTRSPFRITVDE